MPLDSRTTKHNTRVAIFHGHIVWNDTDTNISHSPDSVFRKDFFDFIQTSRISEGPIMNIIHQTNWKIQIESTTANKDGVIENTGQFGEHCTDIFSTERDI